MKNKRFIGLLMSVVMAVSSTNYIFAYSTVSNSDNLEPVNSIHDQTSSGKAIEHDDDIASGCTSCQFFSNEITGSEAAHSYIGGDTEFFFGTDSNGVRIYSIQLIN